MPFGEGGHRLWVEILLGTLWYPWKRYLFDQLLPRGKNMGWDLVRRPTMPGS